MKRSEFLINDLCEEIDQWKAEAKHWKKMYEQERDESIRNTNERLEQSKQGVVTALMFAFCTKESSDGSLVIDKEGRKAIAETIKNEIQ